MRQWCGIAIVMMAAVPSAACSPARRGEGRTDRVLVLLGEQYDAQEFWGPYAVLTAAGYQVDLAGARKGVELTPDSHLPEAHIRTTISLDDVRVSDYFALVVPGGPSAANVARFPGAGRIAREFNAAGKPIGSVCQGASLLMSEGILKDRATTCLFMIADELCDRWRARDYGRYLDLPVVIDGNIISSRDPRDVPAMSGALLDRFAEAGGLARPRRDARALIVLPGVSNHQRWVLDQLTTFGIEPTAWNGADAAGPPPEASASYDMLVILDGTGPGQLDSSQRLASVIDSFRDGRKTILVTAAAKKALPAVDGASPTVIEADGIAQAMQQIVAHAGLASGVPRTTAPDSGPWAARYAGGVVRPPAGASWSAKVEYDAVLALWNGYDDDAAARMGQFLRRTRRRMLIVGPQRGTLRGLNGATAEVAATYDDPIALSPSAVIVAPGGLWPKKTKAQQPVQPQWVEAGEPARQHRLDWLIEQYQSGRMLVAVGFDSLYIGQRGLFKGMRFASSDQASAIWFGADGAEYSPAKAMLSDANLLTAKPLVGIDDAIGLLEQYSASARQRRTTLAAWTSQASGNAEAASDRSPAE